MNLYKAKVLIHLFQTKTEIFTECGFEIIASDKKLSIGQKLPKSYFDKNEEINSGTSYKQLQIVEEFKTSDVLKLFSAIEYPFKTPKYDGIQG